MGVRTNDLQALAWAAKGHSREDCTNFEFLIRKCLRMRHHGATIKRDQITGILMVHAYWTCLWRLMVCCEPRLEGFFGHTWTPDIDGEEGWAELVEQFKKHFPDRELKLNHWHPKHRKAVA